MTNAGTNAGYNYHRFSINSPYDPDVTGIGDEVLGWLEWTAIYSRYMCYGSSWVITFTNASGNGSIEELFCGYRLYGSFETAALPTSQVYRLDPHIRGCIVGSSNNGGSPTKRVMKTGYLSAAALEDITKANYTADTASYSGAYNSDPTKQPIILVFADSLVNGPQVGTFKVHVSIKAVYYLKLYQKAKLQE